MKKANMKKALFTLAATVAAIGSSYGQGYVAFGNSASTTPVKVNTQASPTVFTATANTASPAYYFALFYSTSSSATFNGSTAPVVGGTTSNNSLNSFVTGSSLFTQDPGVLGINNASGRTGGGFGDSNPNNVANGTPVPAGTQDSFIVLGWSANIGSTVASVQAFLSDAVPGETGFVGQSGVGVVTLSPGGNVPINNLFASATTGDTSLSGFNLGYTVPTPEPTSIALGVMGGLSLLALRRKKA